MGGAADSDAHRFGNYRSWMRAAGGQGAKPQLTGSAKIQAVVAAVDLQGLGEASGAAGEVQQTSSLAMFLHQGNAFQWFQRANQDTPGDARPFAGDVEHEVRTVIEENVGVAGSEVHGTDSRRRAAIVMTSGIAGRVSFRFHDASAQTPGGKIVHNDFADEEAC